jgi:hypothetical protein
MRDLVWVQICSQFYNLESIVLIPYGEDQWLWSNCMASSTVPDIFSIHRKKARYPERYQNSYILYNMNRSYEKYV